MNENITHIFKILNKVNFLAFGETEHGNHKVTLEIILKEINKFGQVFLEMPINLQKSVDTFLVSNKIDPDFSDFLKGAQEEGKEVKETLFSILKACKKSNKPVFCVDSSKIKTKLYNKKSKYGFYFLSGNSREEDMFNNIKKVLENSKGKSFLLGGSTHIKYDPESLGSRLQKFLGSNFYNVCLWKLREVKSCQFYDAHNISDSRKLNKLLKKNINTVIQMRIIKDILMDT